nr:glycoside hydrolase family 31 protein [Tessaracoccus sp.]
MSRTGSTSASVSRMAAGVGVSGQAFVGADIGGFGESTTSELFARWMQYGALTPFCRNHSVIFQRDQYPWSFGPAVLDIARSAVELRYRLLPYIYTAFVEAAETGAPVQRPPVFEDQYDGVVVDIDDEYLFGPNLLVAPVLEEGAVARSVYLPRGHWYDWHTDDVLDGYRFVSADAPLYRIPLYARAGAVIPMWPSAPLTTAGYRPEEIELHVFPPVVDGKYTSELQEDDGHSRAATTGARLRTRLVVTRAGEDVTLRAETTGDGFEGFARQRFTVVVHGENTRVLTVDDAGAGFELDLSTS